VADLDDRALDALDELIDARLEDWEARFVLGIVCAKHPGTVLKIVRFLREHRHA